MIVDSLVVSFFFSVYEFLKPSHFRFLYLRSIGLRKTKLENNHNILDGECMKGNKNYATS